MGWFYANSRGDADIFRSAIEEIRGTHDRAAAIVAAALLEGQLTKAIMSSTVEDKTIWAEMFRSSGPLGSFSSKINLGFMLSIYSKKAHKELNTIKEIRNEFAHRMETKNFADQRVRDLSNNLTLFNDFSIPVKHDLPEPNPFHLSALSWKKESPTPRERYTATCQMFCAYFSLWEPKKPELSKL